MTSPGPGGITWCDNHCHLDADRADEQIDRARAAGVTRMVDVGTDVERSRAALERARAHAGVVATAGVHPHDAAGGTGGLAELLAEPDIAAVGECGLDYHYDHSPRPVQRSVFALQVALAAEHDLPLVIHTRDAWDDTFSTLAEGPKPPALIFHCFTGGPDEADRALELGALLSFSGIVTFPNASDVRAAATRCPLDRLLVETDSPYLAPVPLRGRPNEPAYLPHVGAVLADLRGVDVSDIAAATWRNAATTYRWDGAR